MKTAKYVAALLLCILVSTACSGMKKSEENENSEENAKAAMERQTKVKTDGKALVVFFSHAGENYSVGNIEVGNTKVLAGYIAELTGADQFEIVTHKYDGMGYKQLCDLAKEEQQRGELPEFEGAPEDLGQYDTIFIGGPVWWGTYPQVMFTFFSKYDLSGKTVIPFTTHEGSGLGRCAEDVKRAYPQAKVTGAFSLYGHEVRGSKMKAEAWLKELGYGS